MVMDPRRNTMEFIALNISNEQDQVSWCFQEWTIITMCVGVTCLSTCGSVAKVCIVIVFFDVVLRCEGTMWVVDMCTQHSVCNNMLVRKANMLFPWCNCINSRELLKVSQSYLSSKLCLCLDQQFPKNKTKINNS